MKDLKIYWILALTILVLYLFFEYHKPQSVNWTPSYARTDKIPYGTYILYHRLTDLFPEGIRTTRKSLSETCDWQTNQELLVIANSVNISETDYQAMCRFMEEGNNILITANSFNMSFLDSLDLAVSFHDPRFALDSLSFHFTDLRYSQEPAYRFSRGMAPAYFSNFDSLRTTVLARNNREEAVFVHYPYGKGGLFLLASPDFFTNYALLEGRNQAFAAHALSYLSPDKLLVYDEYQALGPANRGSVFRFIFQHTSLKWAYYLSLASLILFVLYEIKRRQRIIPLADPMQNSSVEFAQVVGEVYYQQHDNKDIAQKKTTYLLHNIREQYRLKTGDLNAEFRALLLKRSGVDERLIDTLLLEIQAIQRGKYPNDAELWVFNDHIEQFYEQSSITWNKNFSNSGPTSAN